MMAHLLNTYQKAEEHEKRRQAIIVEQNRRREKLLEQRKRDLELLAEIRRPCDDLQLVSSDLPSLQRIPNLRLSGKAFADLIMVRIFREIVLKNNF